MTKMGLPIIGLVASVNSPAQTVICSAHTVGGMALLATSTAASFELVRLLCSGLIADISGGFSAETATSEGGLA